jgi:hypothetical protein
MYSVSPLWFYFTLDGALSSFCVDNKTDPKTNSLTEVPLRNNQREGFHMQTTQVSPKTLLEQCEQECNQAKQQLSSQITQVTDPKARTAVQMAINSIDHCIAQCHTACGSL